MQYKVETKVYDMPVAEQSAASLENPRNVYEYMRDDFNPVQEDLHVLLLNTKHRVVEKVLVARGGAQRLTAVPVDVLRPVILAGAPAFIVAHNHPSGDIQPSEEDILFTRRMKKAADLLGLSMLDHIIYTQLPKYEKGDRFFSFKGKDLL